MPLTDSSLIKILLWHQRQVTTPVAAYTCLMKIINKVLDLHAEMFTDEIPLIIWGDGCAAYLRSSFVFHLIARMDKKFKVEWCYNERHHGKGTMGVI